MRLNKFLLCTLMLFLITGCVQNTKVTATGQYPIATTANNSYTPQGVSYNQGRVMVFPMGEDIAVMEQNTSVIQPESQYQYPVYTQVSDMAPALNSAPLTYDKASADMEHADHAKLEVKMIYFKHGSSGLNAKDKKILQELAKKMKETEQSARIVGYASQPVYTTKDPVQQDIINMKMGAKRAIAVAKELYLAGVVPGQIETVSRGDGDSNGNNAKDRRIEILLKD